MSEKIEEIIIEWRYRLPAGYPKTEADYHILADVLREQTDWDSNLIQQVVSSAQHGNIIGEQNQSPPLVDQLSELGFPEEINNQILSVYGQLSESEKQVFHKNFRAHTVQSFVKVGYKAFEKFFMINVGGARGGMGNGEISILLGVKGSKSGGTAQHDIVMSNGEWEVKELKSGKFDPAKDGLVSKYNLTAKMKEFYQTIVDPIDDIGDPYQSLKHLVDPASHNDLKRLLMIFDTRFSGAIEPSKFSAFEWKKSAMYNWYEGFKELHQIFYKTKLDTDVRDTRLTVSTDGRQQSFWISDEDAEEIKLSSGEEDTADVFVGDEVDNINSNNVIWLKRLERNEFIRNPQQFIYELNTIKNTFFSGILGLIWYNYRNPAPNLGLPEDFAIDNVSQGRYRFVVKDIPANRAYPHIQEQG